MSNSGIFLKPKDVDGGSGFQETEAYLRNLIQSGVVYGADFEYRRNRRSRFTLKSDEIVIRSFDVRMIGGGTWETPLDEPVTMRSGDTLHLDYTVHFGHKR